MRPYKSLSGKESGVIAYESGEDFIIVEFRTKEKYYYSYKSAGESTIEKMKAIAKVGKGFSTFISQEKPKYEYKFG